MGYAPLVAKEYKLWMEEQEKAWESDMKAYVKKHGGEYKGKGTDALIKWNGSMKDFNPPQKPDTSFQAFMLAQTNIDEDNE